MSTTFVMLPINNDYFEGNVEAIRASINSAIGYCFDKQVDEVHVVTDNPDLIINDLPEFNVIKHYKESGRGELWRVIIRLRSADLEEKPKPNPVPDASDLVGKRSKSEAELLILSYLAEKINKANDKGWNDVTIPHKIPKSIIDVLKSEKNYKFIVHDNCTVISWEV